LEKKIEMKTKMAITTSNMQGQKTQKIILLRFYRVE